MYLHVFCKLHNVYTPNQHTFMYMYVLDYVCWQAKDMVSLVNKFAAKVEEKKGALSEDEVSV